MREFRAPLCLPDEESAATPGTAPCSVHVSQSGWLLRPHREAIAVPRISVLAGTGGEQTRVAEDRRLVPRYWQRAAREYRNCARHCAKHAGRESAPLLTTRH